MSDLAEVRAKRAEIEAGISSKTMSIGRAVLAEWVIRHGLQASSRDAFDVVAEIYSAMEVQRQMFEGSEHA
jgi:hypothetical protein